jgi:hypothetical protein
MRHPLNHFASVYELLAAELARSARVSFQRLEAIGRSTFICRRPGNSACDSLYAFLFGLKFLPQNPRERLGFCLLVEFPILCCVAVVFRTSVRKKFEQKFEPFLHVQVESAAISSPSNELPIQSALLSGSPYYALLIFAVCLDRLCCAIKLCPTSACSACMVDLAYTKPNVILGLREVSVFFAPCGNLSRSFLFRLFKIMLLRPNRTEVLMMA